jgi:Hsp20/alpha crystallin family
MRAFIVPSGSRDTRCSGITLTVRSPTGSRLLPFAFLGDKEQTLLSEFRSNQFYRELRLPAEVDPAKTTAVSKDGVLELGSQKSPRVKPSTSKSNRNNGIFPTDCGKTPITEARIPI